MFNEITESIDGRKFTMAYNARQVSVERNAPRGLRSRHIRRIAKMHQARYSIMYREGDHDVYFLGRSKAVSFQTQLEGWLRANDSGKEPFVLVITLDKAVYFADVVEGYIDAETVLVEEAALENLKTLTNAATPTRLFAGGRNTLQLRGYGLEGPAPVRITRVGEHRYRLLFFLMARQGLYHPGQAMFMALVLVPVLAVGIGYQRYEDRVALIAHELMLKQQRMQQQAGVQIPLKTDFSAALKVVELGHYFTLAEQFYSSGLTSLQYTHTVTIAGETPGYPEQPIRVAADLPWTIDLAPGGGWALSRGTEVPSDIRSPENFKRFRVLEHIHYLAAHADARLAISGHAKRTGVAQIEFTLRLFRPRASHLQRLGQLLANRPYELKGAQCDFAAWEPEQCTLQFSAGTVEEEIVKKNTVEENT